MKKELFIFCLILVLGLGIKVNASERYYDYCSPSNNCKMWFDHGIYNKFSASGSYTISSQLTKKDNSVGGKSYAQLFNVGSSNEFGPLIDQYYAYLTDYGDWVRVHYNNANPNKSYIAAGSTSVSSSNKMLANVK